MKKFLLFSLMVACTTSIWATGLYTSITDIYYLGENERTGSVTFEVTEDDFADASESNPIYLRLAFFDGVELVKSRVNDHRGPISLAMKVTGDPSALINAPADAVSIVRWRKGESIIWLKITASSSTWILQDGVPSAPSYDAPVVFTLGTSAKLSFQDNRTDFLAGRANLPGNFRISTSQNDNESREDARHRRGPASTFIDVDVSEAGLTTTGFSSLLQFDLMGFDSLTYGVETAQDPSEIILGDLMPLSFYGDFVVARGRDL